MSLVVGSRRFWVVATLVSGCLDGGGGPGGFDGGDIGAGSAGAGGGAGAQVNRCAAAPDEREPNDDRERATPYTLAAAVVGCVAARTDEDFYEFVVPNDPGGGYVQVAVTDVGPGIVRVRIHAASDNGEITEQFAANSGQSVTVFFPTAPGNKYRVAVSDFASWRSPYTYRLSASYARVNDLFEPNDSRADARQVQVGTVVMAHLFAGRPSADELSPEAYDDWFRVTLSAGAATVKLEDVASDLLGDLYLLDGQGNAIEHKFADTKGASVTARALTVAAGVHFVRATVFAVPVSAGKGTTVPDHFTHPYRLTVTQP